MKVSTIDQLDNLLKNKAVPDSKGHVWDSIKDEIDFTKLSRHFTQYYVESLYHRYHRTSVGDIRRLRTHLSS